MSKADEIYCCHKCGNVDIEEKHWVKVNSKQLAGKADETNDVHCEICDETTKAVTRTEYMKLSKEPFPIVKDSDEKERILKVIKELEHVELTGEQMEYIIEQSGMLEQITKQLLNKSSIQHRMNMINDDVNNIRKVLSNYTINNEELDNSLSFINIAADLNNDECLGWKLYKDENNEQIPLNI